MARALTALIAATALVASQAAAMVYPRACDPTTLDNSTYLYNVTDEYESNFEIAAKYNRGVCDIARQNLMADVTIPSANGATLIIPAQVCEPDNDSCILKESENPNRTCLLGGPRLYYTKQNDTYDLIALRLGMNVSAITDSDNGGPGGSWLNANTSEVLDPGQFVKIPQCEPSQCIMQPYNFTWGVYKDLADKYNSTVGQMIALSPTYTYASMPFRGGSFPPITVPINCTYLSDDWVVLE